LTESLYWQAVDSQKFHATCHFNTVGYTVALSDLNETPSFRCSGPQTKFQDFLLAVTVTLGTPTSCPTIWFRYQGSRVAGYALQICSSAMTFGLHSSKVLTTLGTITPTPPLRVGSPFRLAIMVSGTTFTVLQCADLAAICDQPQQLGQWHNNNIQGAGVITLGMYEPDGSNPNKLYQATFSNLQVATKTPPPTPSSSVVTPPAGEASTPPPPPPSG